MSGSEWMRTGIEGGGQWTIEWLDNVGLCKQHLVWGFYSTWDEKPLTVIAEDFQDITNVTTKWCNAGNILWIGESQ